MKQQWRYNFTVVNKKTAREVKISLVDRTSAGIKHRVLAELPDCPGFYEAGELYSKSDVTILFDGKDELE